MASRSLTATGTIELGVGDPSTVSRFLVYIEFVGGTGEVVFESKHPFALDATYATTKYKDARAANATEATAALTSDSLIEVYADGAAIRLSYTRTSGSLTAYWNSRDG